MREPMNPNEVCPPLLPDRAGWLLIGGVALLYCWNLGRIAVTLSDGVTTPVADDAALIQDACAWYESASIAFKSGQIRNN